MEDPTGQQAISHHVCIFTHQHKNLSHAVIEGKGETLLEFTLSAAFPLSGEPESSLQENIEDFSTDPVHG